MNLLSDIEQQYFDHLISYAKSVQEMVEDLKAMNGIDASQEAKMFPSESELQSMRENGTPIQTALWNRFWKVIDDEETFKAQMKVSLARNYADERSLDRTNPIQYDETGAYREFRDWDGRPYRTHFEMGN